MSYTYENPDVPAELNFTDIEGPDGYVSHKDALRALENGEAGPLDAELVIAIQPGVRDSPVIKTGLIGTVVNGEYVVPFGDVPNAVDCLRIVTQTVRRAEED